MPGLGLFLGRLEFQSLLLSQCFQLDLVLLALMLELLLLGRRLERDEVRGRRTGVLVALAAYSRPSQTVPPVPRRDDHRCQQLEVRTAAQHGGLDAFLGAIAQRLEPGAAVLGQHLHGAGHGHLELPDLGADVGVRPVVDALCAQQSVDLGAQVVLGFDAGAPALAVGLRGNPLQQYLLRALCAHTVRVPSRRFAAHLPSVLGLAQSSAEASTGMNPNRALSPTVARIHVAGSALFEFQYLDGYMETSQALRSRLFRSGVRES